MMIYPTVFRKTYDGYKAWIPIEDIPIEYFKRDCGYKIMIEVENAEFDSYTELRVIHEREQTPEEKEKFKIELARRLEESKQKRREDYLKLKKEFENESN
jgi:hypothetical protein